MRMETLVLNTATRIIDKQVLIDIYEQHSTELFRYAYRMLGDSELAEDCVAETFSRFLQAVRGGRGPSDNVRAYLYRVAHNWITDQYRRQPPAPVALDEELHATPTDHLTQEVSQRMEQERVRQALRQLPAEQRQVIELRFLENWSHEAVAAALGKTAEATRALQHRAMSALRRLLIEQED